MSEEPEFEIVKATKNDTEKIRSFLRDHFYPFEPINIAMGMENGHSLAAEQDVLELVEEGYSVLALAKVQERTLLGICINGEIFSDEDMIEFVSRCECERHSKYLWFIETVDRCSDFWKKAAVPRALTCEALAVLDSARGLGIGKALLQQTINVAKEEEFPLLRVDCSSYYSARLAEHLGFECMYSLQYCDYKNENGEQIFEPPKPHVEFKMFIYKFD